MEELLNYLENHPVEFKDEDFYEEGIPFKGIKKSNRGKSYYRYQRSRAINKKLYIYRDVYRDTGNFIDNPKFVGSLSKGKVHCSCPMCQVKTWIYGLPISEKKVWDNMKKEIEYYENEEE